MVVQTTSTNIDVEHAATAAASCEVVLAEEHITILLPPADPDSNVMDVDNDRNEKMDDLSIDGHFDGWCWEFGELTA